MRELSIPYSRQSISEEDIQAVVNVLRSDWLTQGPAIESFEHIVADYCGAKYAIAVNSATSALHIACLAVGLDSGDMLWTSPNTFVASANCARYCGARVDFIDIDPRTYNMSATALEKKLEFAEKAGTLPKVIMPVHFAGQPCEMEKIAFLSRKFGFTIIEDASHAIGGRYKNTKIGSCVYSDMTVFSFHPVKIITTGEGGMILTNSRDFYEKLIRLRSHGITRNPAFMTNKSHGPWYYQQIELGFNYRMTDIQAALGISQMRRLDEFVARRQELASRYNKAFTDIPLTTPFQHEDSYSSYHLYVIRLKLGSLQKNRREVFDKLRNSGIGVNIHYIPVHTQPYYRAMGFVDGMFPEAESYYSEAISLPLYFELKQEEQDHVISSVRDIVL